MKRSLIYIFSQSFFLFACGGPTADEQFNDSIGVPNFPDNSLNLAKVEAVRGFSGSLVIWQPAADPKQIAAAAQASRQASKAIIAMHDYYQTTVNPLKDNLKTHKTEAEINAVRAKKSAQAGDRKSAGYFAQLAKKEQDVAIAALVELCARDGFLARMETCKALGKQQPPLTDTAKQIVSAVETARAQGVAAVNSPSVARASLPVSRLQTQPAMGDYNLFILDFLPGEGGSLGAASCFNRKLLQTVKTEKCGNKVGGRRLADFSPLNVLSDPRSGKLTFAFTMTEPTKFGFAEIPRQLTSPMFNEIPLSQVKDQQILIELYPNRVEDRLDILAGAFFVKDRVDSRTLFEGNITLRDESFLNSPYYQGTVKKI